MSDERTETVWVELRYRVPLDVAIDPGDDRTREARAKAMSRGEGDIWEMLSAPYWPVDGDWEVVCCPLDLADLDTRLATETRHHRLDMTFDPRRPS